MVLITKYEIIGQRVLDSVEGTVEGAPELPDAGFERFEITFDAEVLDAVSLQAL